MLFPVKMMDGWVYPIRIWPRGTANLSRSRSLRTILTEVIGGFASHMDGWFPLEGSSGARHRQQDREKDDQERERVRPQEQLRRGCDYQPQEQDPYPRPKWHPYRSRIQLPPLVFQGERRCSREEDRSIHHGNVVKDRDTGLRAKLLKELPNITAKIVNSYHDLRREVGEGDIMQHLPEQIKE